MDIWEHHHAYSFDSDDYVTVFLDSRHASFVALERASDDPDALAHLEIGFGEDLASGGVAGCEEPQEVD